MTNQVSIGSAIIGNTIRLLTSQEPESRYSKLVESTLNSSDVRYDKLGEELNTKLGRCDGVQIAKKIHGHMERECQEWFYDCVFCRFESISLNEWPQQESSTAAWKCCNAILFFQSVLAASDARSINAIAANQQDWFVNWLLRLTIGNTCAEGATINWLPQLQGKDADGVKKILVCELSDLLPTLKGKEFLLSLFAPTLLTRTTSVMELVFGSCTKHDELRLAALMSEEQTRSAIGRYIDGGCHYMVLESKNVFPLVPTRNYGELFQVFTNAVLAKSLDDALLGGKHTVSQMSFRELDSQLNRLYASGVRYVIVDRTPDGKGSVYSIVDFHEHVKKTISGVDCSELGQKMKDGFEDLEASPALTKENRELNACPAESC